MSLLRSLIATGLVAVMSTVAAAAESGEPVSVKVNMARILRISAPASTVIIGNPAVADVTIQDPQTLVLTGKSYGETNLIVLDGQGNPVADTRVSVVQDTSNTITMYMGSARTTLSCQPICQPTLTLGDDQGFTTTTYASSSLLQTAAGAR